MSNPVISKNGDKKWYNSEGELHRLEGPAWEYKDGYKEWWVNGKLHRLDGPAMEYLNGAEYYWVDGVEFDEQDYLEAVLLYICKQVLES
jgi:hypothetical protein